MNSKKQLTYSQSQSGFVSIVVTMILMIVLTLIVTGFALLSRREQRAALDRQLSTQAYYAAESGVNDLWAAMLANKSYFFQSNPSNNNCNTAIGGGFTPVDPSTTYGVKYTCLLYNSNPLSLVYNSVSADQATVATLTNTNLSKLSITWDSTDSPSTFQSTSYKTLPPSTAWTANTGLLRVMIIPLESNPDRQKYINDTFTAFMYPNTTAAPTVSWATGLGINSSGLIVPGNCSVNTGCTVSINNLPAVARGFYIVMRSAYVDSNVKITGYDSSNSVIPLTGAQVEIDATGQANDVLRRIAVRKPIIPSCDNFCPVGFTSMDPICKQITIDPSDTGNEVKDGAPGGCSFP